MATPSFVPFPSDTARTDVIEPVRAQRSCYFLYENERSLAAIDDYPDLAWERLNLLLPNSTSIEAGHDFGAPARMEFFWNDSAGKRGVVIFDGYGRVIVHVLNALLGYAGEGPYLSWMIVERLGISPEMFDAITESVRHQRPYKVVVSRESIVAIEEESFVDLIPILASEWQWCRVL